MKTSQSILTLKLQTSEPRDRSRMALLKRLVMRCIFCRKTDVDFTRVEHIIPESLGNKEIVLPPGVVCDKCNQYFGTKVEGPVLESALFATLRSEQSIPSKKNRIPPAKGLLYPDVPVTLRQGKRDVKFLDIGDAAESKAIRRLLGSDSGTLFFPASFGLPTHKLMSRFLAKCALEYLTSRVLDLSGNVDECIFEEQFDPIRNHARFGHHNDWSFSDRTIHNMNATTGDKLQPEQIIHEMDLLLIPASTEAYYTFYVVSFFGREFAINCADQSIDKFTEWLTMNDNQSPLYTGKNSSFKIPR